MADRHKHQPVSVRLPPADRAWLREHAARTGEAVHAVIVKAVRAYIEEHREDDNTA